MTAVCRHVIAWYRNGAERAGVEVRRAPPSGSISARNTRRHHPGVGEAPILLSSGRLDESRECGAGRRPTALNDLGDAAAVDMRGRSVHSARVNGSGWVRSRGRLSFRRRRFRLLANSSSGTSRMSASNHVASDECTHDLGGVQQRLGGKVRIALGGTRLGLVRVDCVGRAEQRAASLGHLAHSRPASGGGPECTGERDEGADSASSKNRQTPAGRGIRAPWCVRLKGIQIIQHFYWLLIRVSRDSLSATCIG